jgi:hypothetical protein
VSICKGLAFSGTQIGQSEGDLIVKLWTQRVDDALQLCTIRSPRQEHLDNGWLPADDVKPMISWLAGQYDERHNG